MNIYDKISRMRGKESYDEKMYILLNTKQYRQPPYEMQDLGEQMSLINQSIWGWWKPRFLVDHHAKCAYELMNSLYELVTVRDADIDWNSLKRLPDEAIERAKAHNAYFPTLIFGFRGGKAEVKWQINPDGQYYMDDDGFGMTNDVEIALYGAIDRSGKVVKPFKYHK